MTIKSHTLIHRCERGEANWREAGYYLAYGGKDLGFSFASCANCKDLSYGDRFEAFIQHQESLEYWPIAVCLDCINYIANGTLPID